MLACHLAWTAKKENKRVLFIDFDVQGNASYALSETPTKKINIHDVFSDAKSAAAALNGSDFSLVEASGELADIDQMSVDELIKKLSTFLNLLSEHYDFCFIDIAPTLNSSMVAASAVADFVVSPMEVDIFSLLGIKNLLIMINNLKKVNKKIQFLGIVPNKVDLKKPRIKNNLLQIKNTYNDIVIPYYISNRDSFAESMDLKQPVWKNRKSAAREASREIKKVISYIFEKVGA